MKRLLTLFIFFVLCISMCLPILASVTDSRQSGNEAVDTPPSGNNSYSELWKDVFRIAFYNDTFYQEKSDGYYDISNGNVLVTDSSLAFELERAPTFGITKNGLHKLLGDEKYYNVVNDTYVRLSGDDVILVTDPDLIEKLETSPYVALSGSGSNTALHHTILSKVPTAISLTVSGDFFVSLEGKEITLGNKAYYITELGLEEVEYVHRWWWGLFITVICAAGAAAVPPVIALVTKKAGKDEDSVSEENGSVSDYNGYASSASFGELEGGYVNLAADDASAGKKKKRTVYIDHFFFIHITIFICSTVTAVLCHMYLSAMISLIIAAAVSLVFAILGLFNGSYLMRQISMILAVLFTAGCVFQVFFARSYLVWGIVTELLCILLFVALTIIAHRVVRKSTASVE